ncbi:hypothetical protein [Pedobacter sp. JCM 36344]|uniref:hypothetical protein n=1 Tax=Pedobacter sp. JCM 36344 TaxID=3374280 RepID=UPI00397AF480
MKSLTLALATLLFFTSAACKKNSPEKELEKKLIGKWKFTGRTGGLAGSSEPAKPPVKNSIEFKKGGKYIRYTNDEPMFQGDYKLSKAKSIYTGKVDNTIRFDPKIDSPETGKILSIIGDTLAISDNFNDGYTAGYVRIN